MTDPALDEIDLDYARAVADRPNHYMSLHEIAPTPNNCAI
jgi:hypothetical protein